MKSTSFDEKIPEMTFLSKIRFCKSSKKETTDFVQIIDNLREKQNRPKGL